MKELSLEKRKCECCGGEDLELVYSDQAYLKTYNETYLFHQHVVVCRKCGFCFNSPCPTKEDLEDYYADCFSINELLPLAYSVDSRINVLKNYAFKQANFVEIGGDKSSKFHERLLEYVGSIQNIELNNECSSDLKTMDSLSEASVDILACYDVLEHLPRVKDFFQSCRRILKNGGIMMIEAPDIKLYPYNLMLVSCVHVNHFSTHTLKMIANNSGFKLIEIRHAASSRPSTGFLAVFKKENDFDESCTEYLENLACLKDGVKQINKLRNHIEGLRERIVRLSQENKKITLWCVTGFLYKLIDNFELQPNVAVVDSDARKKDSLKDKKILVLQPDDCLKHIKESELLVILSPRNKENILEWIKKNTGKSFKKEELEIIGDGLLGEAYDNV